MKTTSSPYTIIATSQYRKNYKRAFKRGLDIRMLDVLVVTLIDTGSHSDLFNK